MQKITTMSFGVLWIQLYQFDVNLWFEDPMDCVDRILVFRCISGSSGRIEKDVCSAFSVMSKVVEKLLVGIYSICGIRTTRVGRQEVRQTQALHDARRNEPKDSPEMHGNGSGFAAGSVSFMF